MKAIKSLNIQLSLIIVFITTLVLIGFGVYQYQMNADILKADTEKNLNMAINRLSTSLSLPVFALYDEGIENIILSELNNPLITDIHLELPWKKEKNKYSYTRKNGDKVKKTELTFVEELGLSSSKIINYEGEELGIVKIKITNKFAKENMQKLLQSIVSQILIVDLILITFFIFFLKRKVINPLKKLKEISVKVSGGDLNVGDISIKANNEIGELATALNKMTKNLVKSNKELLDYNKNLEETIKERTLDLQSRTKELETNNQELIKFNKIIVDRELKMVELKKKINDLGIKINP